jgi:hypothetical protein
MRFGSIVDVSKVQYIGSFPEQCLVVLFSLVFSEERGLSTVWCVIILSMSVISEIVVFVFVALVSPVCVQSLTGEGGLSLHSCM